MKNALLDRGILLPTGEISKDKINLVAGAVTEPFAEMVWATTGGDWETINRLTDILVTMNTAADCGKLFKIVQMLYGLLGLRFSEEAAVMGLHPEVLLETGRKGKLIRHHSASNLSNRAFTLSKTGCSPDAIFAFTSPISSLSSLKYFLG